MPTTLTDDFVNIPITKSLFDKIFSIILLIFTLPISLTIIAAIIIDGFLNREDSGPLFFLEKRVSAGKLFSLYKFRIFKVSAISLIGKPGVITKSVENNPENLTRVGKVLKKWGFDELPQLWSVLKGDMTIVGPRPVPLNEFEAETAQGIYRKKVMRTGLTGPVQVMKGTERTKDQEIEADNLYIEKLKRSGPFEVLQMDTNILIKTIKVVLKRTGE